jgi:transcriptional regulator with XRE-family HTH domain
MMSASPRSHPQTNLQAIGDRVRQLRGFVLQDELAAELGISQGQLSKIESGKVAPTVEVLVGLAGKFKTSIH